MDIYKNTIVIINYLHFSYFIIITMFALNQFHLNMDYKLFLVIIMIIIMFIKLILKFSMHLLGTLIFQFNTFLRNLHIINVLQRIFYF
jgi:hypothetical protein